MATENDRQPLDSTADEEHLVEESATEIDSPTAEAEAETEQAPQSPGARLKRTRFFRTRRRTLLTLLLGLPLLLCLSYWLFGFIAFADTASLVELKGLVQTRLKNESRWQSASLNQLLHDEDRVRTSDDASARLLFFDVSTVELEEKTEVSITEVSRRRGGDAINVVLKVWFGKTAVRAVRFVDPSSAFRVDTPTASTVVRGARFTVDVAEDGTTQIDLEEGSAEIEIEGETLTLAMGERITLDPDGLYETEIIFEPDGEIMFDKIENAWNAAGDRFRLELTDTEVNQYLAFVGQQQPDFFLRDIQLWFVEGEARAAATVTQPARFDLSAALGVQVQNGKIEPDIRNVAAGVALPVPKSVLNTALDAVLGQLEEYLDQAYTYVKFDEIQIKDGYIIITGQKQPDAPPLD